SITGPGIWFSATVANPRGISALIHNFVWVWAAEWIWFVAEVTLVYILFYTLGRVDQRTWLKLAWIFAIGSWATMYIIVGILSFMLSPGHERWFTSGNILDAFYNKNYFPHLLMRSAYMFAIAGTIGIVIARLIKNNIPENVYKDIVKTMSYWGIGGLILGSMFFGWYYSTLPERSIAILNSIIPKTYYFFIFTILLLLIAHFTIVAIKPTLARAWIAYPIYVLIFFLGVYPEEKVRETIRKPYIAGEFIWVNQIIARDVPAKGIEKETEKIAQAGFLKVNPFVPEGLKTITTENKLMAGKAIAILQCSGCHNINGSSGLRPFTKKFEGMTTEEAVYGFLASYLTPQNHPPYMPYFVGKDEELRALSAFIADMNSRGGSVSAKIEVPQAKVQR
ncbi:MAG: cytochrome C, partial [Aquificaceae bacterium]|nr:cytochrome C [Aquificaceae bacterium]